MRRHRKSNKWQQQSEKKLTSAPKIDLRLESPDLRLSKRIVAIHIECGVDWCIRQAGDMVRRHPKIGKWRQQSDKKHLPFQKKSPYGLSRRTYANPNELPQSGSNAASIDVSDRLNSEWDDIEWTKRDGNIGHTSTYFVTKNRLSTRAAGSTPIPKHCRNWDRMLHRLMYQTGSTVNEMTSIERKETAT